MSTGDIIVLIAVAVVIIGAITVILHDFRSGKCTCGCKECSGCCNKCIDVKDEQK